MDMNAVLVTAGLAVLGLLGYVLLDVLGQTAVGAAGEAMSRRPSFAVRRRRNRRLMMSGVWAVLLAATSGWLWLAAATSGSEDTADDARLLGLVTLVLVLAGCGLLAAWWRRSGAPRH